MKELSLNNCRLDNRYDIQEQLGRGSYAEVYAARDILASTQSPHSRVVIKALNVFLQDDVDDGLERTLVENFQNEAIALDRVRHPNIISRLGHGTARDLNGTVFHYLVLEYLAGGDLSGLLRKEKIPLHQSMRYIEQICAGLGHAHEKGIIHRDIKPHNLLLTEDLVTVKIADFGVARVEASDSPITRVGTNIYAPPEHSPMSAGSTGTLAFSRLTPAADIYSLAKSVYTLVTGESPRAYANAQVTDLPDPARDEECSEELLRVIKKATSDDARERHQSVEEFWIDLSAIRRVADENGASTVLKSTASVPQPHVTRGYTPIVPERPSFESLSERPSVHVANATYTRPIFTRAVQAPPPAVINGSNPSKPAAPDVRPASPKRRRRVLRGFAVFLIFAGIFTGLLYGTASYMRGRGSLPSISNPFASRTATANTDIYLRPSPNTDNEPVGLVTKNSRVRIVNSQNNWYQVDVLEQGRVRASQASATRGWLNGKYLNISN